MKYLSWWLPILILILITPLVSAWDLAIARHYYHDGHFVSNNFITFMYSYGFWPGDILTAIALLVLLLSYFTHHLEKWRKPALLLVLTMGIGAGIITHAVLKDHWGRPRPKQVEEFGGSQLFRTYYQPNFFHQPEPSKSFPCGHCTAGFFFFALALIGKRLRSPSLYWGGIVLALLLGIALSWTRIAQGGHFLSDTLFSALIMWFTALGCERLIYGKPT